MIKVRLNNVNIEHNIYYDDLVKCSIVYLISDTQQTYSHT